MIKADQTVSDALKKIIDDYNNSMQLNDKLIISIKVEQKWLEA